MNQPGNPADVQIRYAHIDDLPTLAPLFAAYRTFYEQPYDEELALRYVRERICQLECVVLLAHRAGAAVGFIQLYPGFCSIAAARIWTLSDLFVTPAARGHGVARALMQKATAFATHSGAVRMDLSTAHANINAQALYEGLGYQLDTTYRYYSLPIKPTA